MTKLYALMRQTEFGDFTAKKSALEQISSATSSQVNAFEKDVEMEHEQLMGMSASVAKLKFISTLAKTGFPFRNKMSLPYLLSLSFAKCLRRELSAAKTVLAM